MISQLGVAIRGILLKEEMSVYIVTVPNMIQFATLGEFGRSIIEGDIIVWYIEGRRRILYIEIVL